MKRSPRRSQAEVAFMPAALQGGGGLMMMGRF